MHHFGDPDYEITDPCPEENGAKPGPNDNQNLSKCHSHQEPFKETTREKVMPPISEDQWKESSKTLVIFRKALQN